MEPISALLCPQPQLKMSPCPQRVETSRPRGHVSITRLTAVWTTPHTGHSPSWTLCCYKEAATGPSPPSIPAARQVTLSPRAQGLSTPRLPFRKVLSMDGTHATAVWTLSHQSNVTTSPRLSEFLMGRMRVNYTLSDLFCPGYSLNNLQLYLYTLCIFRECCIPNIL